jgi:hypothetical protein
MKPDRKVSTKAWVEIKKNHIPISFSPIDRNRSDTERRLITDTTTFPDKDMIWLLLMVLR